MRHSSLATARAAPITGVMAARSLAVTDGAEGGHHFAGSIENRVRIHDLHAAMRRPQGLNHEQHTYRHAGSDYRLADVCGNVAHDLIA